MRVTLMGTLPSCVRTQVAALLATPSALVLEIASAAVESWMSPAMYTVHPPLVSTALSVFITQPHTNMVVSRAMISSSCRLIATFCERVSMRVMNVMSCRRAGYY